MGPFETTILSIVIMIFLGYSLKRVKLLKIDDVDTLNKIVINLAMPCMIFSALYSADLSSLSTLSIMPLLGVTVGGISGLIMYSILSIKKYPKKEKWSIIIPTALGNTAFLGFPVTLGIFGHTALIRAIFYDLASLITFLSLSIILMIKFGGKLKEVVKKVLSFPILWAAILGISTNLLNLNLDGIAMAVIDYMADITIPLVMISLGLSLQFISIKNNFKIGTLVSAIKLLVAPVVSFCIVSLIGLSGFERTIGIVEAAMSSGMLSLALAVNYNLDFKLTTDCVVITTIFGLITMPFIIGLI